MSACKCHKSNTKDIFGLQKIQSENHWSHERLKIYKACQVSWTFHGGNFALFSLHKYIQKSVEAGLKHWTIRTLRAQASIHIHRCRDSEEAHITKLLLTVWTVGTCSNWRWKGIAKGECTGCTRAQMPIICQPSSLISDLGSVHFIFGTQTPCLPWHLTKTPPDWENKNKFL